LSRADLLDQAARCYQRAELHADAGRCYRDAGRMVLAGRAYQDAGDLANAAECLRAGAEFTAAAELYERLDRPEDAALCWERARDPLRAGWVLATRTRRVGRAARLLRGVGDSDPATRLRKELALGVCGARGEGRVEPLERALLRCERDLAEIRAGRALVEEWAVRAADLLGRHDLSARIFAASHRAGTRDAARRWREWAVDTLGDAFGVPADEGG
jgi:tetratricopeptide (TPR) repeat protein